MRAIVLEKFGGLDSLVYNDIPEPEPKAGHVVIEIKAFGINHAEMHMRRGEWAEAARGQRHRMRRHREVVSGRRIPGRRKGCGADGRLGPHHQRKLCRVHASAGVERRADRIRSVPGPNSRRSPRPTRRPGHVSFAISKSSEGQTRGDSRRDIVVRTGRGQDGRQCRAQR